MKRDFRIFQKRDRDSSSGEMEGGGGGESNTM